MDLFEKIIPKDNRIERIRLSQMFVGRDAIRLTMSTIFLYMIPIAISKYIVDIMNLYVVSLLAGLTGAFWGSIITKAVNDKDKIMTTKPWLSREKYISLMNTLTKQARNYIFGIIIEIGIIAVFNIY